MTVTSDIRSEMDMKQYRLPITAGLWVQLYAAMRCDKVGQIVVGDRKGTTVFIRMSKIIG